MRLRLPFYDISRCFSSWEETDSEIASWRFLSPLIMMKNGRIRRQILRAEKHTKKGQVLSATLYNYYRQHSIDWNPQFFSKCSFYLNRIHKNTNDQDRDKTVLNIWQLHFISYNNIHNMYKRILFQMYKPVD